MGTESRHAESQGSKAVQHAALQDLQDAIANRDAATNPVARALRTIIVADRQCVVDSLADRETGNSLIDESKFQSVADRLLCSENRLAQATGIAVFAVQALGAASYEVAHEKITQIKQG